MPCDYRKVMRVPIPKLSKARGSIATTENCRPFNTFTPELYTKSKKRPETISAMQTKTILSLAALCSTTFAKSYILFFERGPITPNSYVDAAKAQVINLGGTITHEYSTVLTGFSFSIPDKISIASVESINNPEFPFVLEVDSQVHTA